MTVFVCGSHSVRVLTTQSMRGQESINNKNDTDLATCRPIEDKGHPYHGHSLSWNF